MHLFCYVDINTTAEVDTVLPWRFSMVSEWCVFTNLLFLGKPPIVKKNEKTILLVGATGTGKTTLVDGIINFVTGVAWKDPYRFSLIDLENEEKNKNQVFI